MATDSGENLLEGQNSQTESVESREAFQIVKEALSQKEPMGQIVGRHQVSEGLIYRWHAVPARQNSHKVVD